MIVVIARKLPPAVAGRMKLWFLELQPGVYISGLNNATAIEVADYLFSHCPESSGLMIIISKQETPGYEIRTKGVCEDQLIKLSGLQLVRKASIQHIVA